MQLLTLSPGTGKLGGLVASNTRHGARFAARPTRTQPRTASQTSAQAMTGQLPALWRSLTPTQRKGWAQVAPPPLSGYAQFIANNRRLLTIGAHTRTDPPSSLPNLQPILSFTAAALYDNPITPTRLVGFALTWPLSSTHFLGGVLRATGVLSPAKSAIRASDARIVATLTPLPPRGATVFARWLRIYGHGPGQGRVTFLLNLVDLATGFAGPPVRAFADVYIGALPPNPTGGLFIEVDTLPVASVPSSQISMDGTPIAASH